MKTGIHPTWFHNTKVTCACGATFITGSTHDTLTVDICSKCHPFFTGELRFVDRQGRVDKFMQRMQVAAQKQAAAQKAQPKAAAAVEAVTEDPKSYQDILREQQAKLRKSKKATPAE